ncbi:APC family permease [Dasania sp. GY-MA-18]|uniref:APC family permease n=1 Tax=Dasania phycosphaerae TaxID=2950436 RepID=A0A9J6RNJ1_9GAMM|nr:MULTISPECIES: APC family permease [Dasania]MCR8923279.1 APC family permease [Dasania sp. GY-MA-18]MCZ0865711.1 APC family permease [Dasania phycosphaerae]MCZ0869436.1 APC family permease [Dasania phycosphaerae]
MSDSKSMLGTNSVAAKPLAGDKSLGTWDVFVAGVALVVAASTLVSDFNGYFTLGGAFVIALIMGFLINLFLAVSAAELSARYPKSGAIYNYAKAIFAGHSGVFIGTFLGLSFFGMFAFTAAGETAAGALGLQALIGQELPLNYFIVSMMVLAALPSVFGTKEAAWVSAGLLLFMLGIRWVFGLSGFFGWGHDHSWQFANIMDGVELFNFRGENGILMVGLALAFWSFVGVEFACSLAEDVPNPKRSMPRGLIIGLLGILVTSLVMGLGVTGIMPLSEWHVLVQGDLGQNGEAPQLAAGQVMFGEAGYYLMALASATATLGTLTIAFNAIPRILHTIAKDGYLLGPLSPFIAQLHPKLGTPVNAIAITFITFVSVAVSTNAVVDWILSAAYVWILIYIGFHLLAFISRWDKNSEAGAFKRSLVLGNAVVGSIATVIALYYAFIGDHANYGGKALIVLGIAFALAALSYYFHRHEVAEQGLEVEGL